MTKKQQQHQQQQQQPQPLTADDSRALLDSLVAEKDLQKNVFDLAHDLGFLIFHVYDSRLACAGYVDPGFPDAILVKAGRIIAAELKKETGKVSLNQAQWLTELAWLGRVETYVFRPHDWSSGHIEEILRGRDMASCRGA